MMVLYDSGDGVAFPFEGEGVVSDVVVRKAVYEVQHKHWRHPEQHKHSGSV